MEKKNLSTHTRTAKPSTLRRRPLITRITLCVMPYSLGYWLVTADGGIFPYGDAPGLGSLA